MWGMDSSDVQYQIFYVDILLIRYCKNIDISIFFRVIVWVADIY